MTTILNRSSDRTALMIGYVGFMVHGLQTVGHRSEKIPPAVEMEDGVDYVAAKPAVLWDTTFHPSRVEAPSTNRSRPQFSAGYPYSYGASSAESSLAPAGLPGSPVRIPSPHGKIRR